MDGGKKWSWGKVTGYECRDGRAIEVFDGRTAIVIAVGEPALIVKTTDGGKNGKKVYENTTVGMFLDAMEFSSDSYGIVIGDPVNGKFFMARTTNGGDSWKEFN